MQTCEGTVRFFVSVNLRWTTPNCINLFTDQLVSLMMIEGAPLDRLSSVKYALYTATNRSLSGTRAIRFFLCPTFVTWWIFHPHLISTCSTNGDEVHLLWNTALDITGFVWFWFGYSWTRLQWCRRSVIWSNTAHVSSQSSCETRKEWDFQNPHRIYEINLV